MPFQPPADVPRCAVVDLGSNSVRLVVYEGHCRNPVAIFNEKAVLRLGRGLQATGRLNEEGMGQAFTVMHRYHAVARAMGAAPFEVLATAAVRDAATAPDFVAGLQARLPGVPIRILSGAEEAEFSAMGVLCGIPAADGILADIGGGSLELVRLERGARGVSQTLRLGAIRLAERAGGDPVRARAIAEADLADGAVAGRGRGPRPLSGRRRVARAGAHPHGADRLSAADGAPLHDRPRGGARSDRRDRRRGPPGAGASAGAVPPPHRRPALSPRWCCAACCARPASRRVVFSASGLREGWFMQRMPEAIRAQDPLLAARARTTRCGWAAIPTCRRRCWPGPIRCSRPRAARRARLREAACWMSDIGSHDHPEFRAEQAFLRVLRQPGIGLDHHARAFLALAIAMRYEVDAGRAVPAPGAPAAGCGEHASGGGAGRGAAPGLHAVGGHA